jgi:putative membrane protein
MSTPSFPGGGAKWWQSGHRPDYRFSLANERTFLAWIRTSLALVAGAVGIDQFAVHLGSAAIRCALAMSLFAAGGVLAATAYRRWAAAEAAMRHDADLPRTGLMPALAAVATLLAIAVAAVVLAD